MGKKKKKAEGKVKYKYFGVKFKTSDGKIKQMSRAVCNCSLADFLSAS